MLKNQQVSECDNMKVLKDIENQAININGMSIMKAFCTCSISFIGIIRTNSYRDI